jgi:CRP-like cAMP-binding protein
LHLYCCNRIGEGATFGEIALINPDCIRTASVVADERTDLVVIRRDLYNRSLSKVIAKEYKEKTDFIDSQPLFDDWPKKLKKHMAACLKKETLTFDCPIVKQGAKVDNLYFIVR